MEFLTKNLFDTTTQAVVNSSTATVENLMLRDTRYQYISSGLASDAGTNATIRINFAQTLAVSRIALVDHNLKDFTVYYNGVTANTFVLTSTGATIASDFSANAETSNFLTAEQVYCTSVSIDMAGTLVANQEKALGYLVISNVLTSLKGRIPNAQNFRPTYNSKQVVHELSDGSFRSQVVDTKFSCDVGFDFVSLALKNELKTVFNMHDDFVFVAFGTTTAWDNIIFPCIWSNGFEFEEYTDNAAAAGYSGSIRLLETRPG